MRRALHALLSPLLLLLLPTLPAHADEVVVDGIAAQVGTDIVLLSEVMEVVSANERRLRKAGAPDAEIQKLRAEGLEAMIETRLLEQVARQAQLEATDAEVDATIDAIARENKLTAAQVKRNVEAQGMSYATYRAELKRQLERQKVVNAMLGPKVRVDEEDTRKLFETRFADQPQQGTALHLRQILVPGGGEAPRSHQEACSLVGSIREAVEKGESFQEMARKYSVSAPELGGDVGWMHLDSMAPWMVEIVKDLPAGSVSTVKELPFGCTIVEVVERKEWHPVSYEDVKPMLEAELYDRRMSAEYHEWMEELRSKTFIERRGYFADAATLGSSPQASSEFQAGLEGFSVLSGSPEEAPAQ